MAISNLFTQLQPILKKMLKILAKIGDFFDDSALFKGMQHVTPKPAQVILGIKMFVKIRATIQAILNALGRMSWHVVAKLLKKSQITTPPSGENFSQFFSEVYFTELDNIKRIHFKLSKP